MSEQQKITSFRAFWHFYLHEHRNPLNRGLHFAGTSLALICLLLFLLTFNAGLILLGLICGYGCAWVGHFFIERNQPASFKYPLWSFLADWKMWFYILTRRMRRELQSASVI